MTDIDAFWARCRTALTPDDPGACFGVKPIGNTPQLSDSLLGLIASRQKTGLFSGSAPEESQPRPGDCFVFTDCEGRPRCAVRMVECRVVRFMDVGPVETACESPAARDLAAWRDIHGRFWKRTLEAQGRSFSEDMPLLFQRFELLYAEPAPAA
jgi:uncharacterized protein YhfF